ncbi:MAG: hypothetical protein CL878_15525 [Dehalococcoidia bacterium]|nr:hypothetical protein [Dehalococcoidia bacterium]
MTPEGRPVLVVRAARLLDGSETPPLDDGMVVAEGGRIAWVGPAAAAPETYRRLAEGADATPGVQVASYPNGTVLPGLIDTHTHFSLPADGRRYGEVMSDPDGMHILNGVRNARLHLQGGVTTARDLGARNRVAFDLRAGQQRGLFPAPRLLVAGRSIACTGGHFWFCGEEADGPEAVRRSVRRLVHEGADVIKVMTTGGGTAGTLPEHASYTTVELQSLVDEAHDLGCLVVAHCRGSEGMERAVTAGVDVMEHLQFLVPRAAGQSPQAGFDQRLADRLGDSDVLLSPTIQALGYNVVHRLGARRDAEGPEALTGAEQQEMAEAEARVEAHFDILGRLLDAGLASRFIAGSDSGPGTVYFGNLQLDLEAMVLAGFGPLQTIAAATSVAARAVGLDHEIGRLEPGLAADLLIVDGDPSTDIAALRQVQAVYQSGQPVYS